MKTKREIVALAFTEIGLGDYTYDAQSSDFADGLARLDALLAEWGSEGASTGYNAGDLNAASGIPMDAVRSVVCAVAVDIAPSYGRTPSNTTKANARRGRALMMRKNVKAPPRRMATEHVPAGAGYKLPETKSFSQADHDIMPGGTND